MVLKVGTDCSGIEAPIEALKQMKIPFKQVFACEIDVYARKSMEANYHCEKTYLDITKRDISTVPNLDMYICGFPCQAFSTIGNRKGTRDSRGTIFNYCLLLIKKKKPKKKKKVVKKKKVKKKKKVVKRKKIVKKKVAKKKKKKKNKRRRKK